jgi:hypothetical protein
MVSIMTSLLFSIILLVLGLLQLLKYDSIIRFQGESKDYSYEQRKQKLIISGIGFLIGGFVLFLYSLFN